MKRGSMKRGSVKRGSMKRGSVKRGSMKRGSMKRGSMKRGSMKRGSMKSGSLSFYKETKARGGSARKSMGVNMREYLCDKEVLQKYFEFYRELMRKKEELVKDCKSGRRRFIEWFAWFLRAEGMQVEQREVSGSTNLDIYGPEGPPKAVLAYPLKLDPQKWTMCVFGRYEQVEPRLKEPALLFDGRFVPRRRPPETWPVIAIWLSFFKAVSNGRVELPVNLKFCFTAFQTDDSATMIKFIDSIKGEFLRMVDFYVYGTTLGNTKIPGGVIYSGRGVCNFVLEIYDGHPTKEWIHSSETGLFHQAASDAMYMLQELQKDCVYSAPHMLEDFTPPKKFLKLVKRIYVRDLNPMYGYYYRKQVLKTKKKQAMDMWRPEVTIQDIEGFNRDDVTATPTKLKIRFFVKYMTEASPIQIEEMVSRLLAKKWVLCGSPLSVRLGMDYWSRPWCSSYDNRMFHPLRKAAKKAFHRCPTEALDFAPNSLPAILDRLAPQDFAMVNFASTLDLSHPQFQKNFKRNLKMLFSFIQSLGTVKTERAHSWKCFRARKRTRPYRTRHKRMERERHPSPDPFKLPPINAPLLPPEPDSDALPRSKGKSADKSRGSRQSMARKSMKRGSVKRGSMKRGSVKRGSVKRGSVKRGSVKRGSVKRKSKAK